MSALPRWTRAGVARGLQVLHASYGAPGRDVHSTGVALALSKRQSRIVKALTRKDDFGRKKGPTYQQQVDSVFKSIGRNLPTISANAEQLVLSRPKSESVKFIIYSFGSAGNLLYWMLSSNQMYHLPESAQIFSPTLTYIVTGFSALFWALLSLYVVRNVQSLSFRGPDAGQMVYQTFNPFGLIGRARTVRTSVLLPSRKKNVNDSSFTLRLKNSRLPLFINGAKGIADEDLFRKLQLGGANIMAESLRRCFSKG
eukprot:Plantae.Rhodophyta-Purpureofilum_apyrenoidigerum.ctg14062.p1 GENE.Plantae.Rhodophyta-Purpureofilum_apyrenoidigerum.ctg14062~~Plantae.Rhodophyta-Purpureofilum_apyrenoidigerum.ctg14062.p1  ORF type:complete len:255 (-),score=31.99 Plantae.Rhodophyta-Purpureofilum_apyrenoidigerum.ctg14062:1376-2140(-)